MRQASAWGQFWWDLSERHRVHGCGIFTPLWHEPRPVHRGLYYGTWYKSTDLGPIYYSVNGDTMIDMLRDGLTQLKCDTLHMKIALLNVAIEHVCRELEKRL